MSHEITNRDSLVLVGQPAWHGLGRVVQDAPTVDEALRLARLNRIVIKRPLFMHDGFGTVELPSHVATVYRDEADFVLGVVGRDWEPFQNAEVADFAFAVQAAAAREGFDNVRVETAGSMRGGRVVFFLLALGEYRAAVLGDESDRIRSYALLCAAHDGTGSFNGFDTDTRVVCANTKRAAEAEATGRGFRIPHTKNMRDRVAKALEGLQGFVAASRVREQRAQAMARTPMTSEMLRDFFLGVYQDVHGQLDNPRMIQDAKQRATAQRRLDRAHKTVARWLARMDEPEQTVAGIGGTVWAAHNAITGWADHERTVRGEKSDPMARQWSNLFGSAHTLKQVSETRAMALVS